MKVAGERARQMLGSNDDSKGLPKEEFASPGINQQVQITMRDPDKSKTSKTSHPHTAPREKLASFVGVPRSRRPLRRRWLTGGSRGGQESHRHVDTTHFPAGVFAIILISWSFTGSPGRKHGAPD